MPLPHALARFNRVVTNPLVTVVTGRLPFLGILVHQGRRSGRTYRTPVNVFARDGGFVIALTYGRGDWVKNLCAAGEAELRTRGRAHRVANPRVVRDPTRGAVPAPVRAALGIVKVEEFLLLDDLGNDRSPT
jgi:deazaflavin-dependent oxidoreductase (nitroreductase family)